MGAVVLRWCPSGCRRMKCSVSEQQQQLPMVEDL